MARRSISQRLDIMTRVLQSTKSATVDGGSLLGINMSLQLYVYMILIDMIIS